jgi:hypothetical protein
MKLEQRIWSAETGWRVLHNEGPIKPSLVMFFAAPGTCDDGRRFAELKAAYPSIPVVGCTTGGEIAADAEVYDDSIVATAIEFERTAVAVAEVALGVGESSLDAGKRLAAALPAHGLNGIFVLSDGTRVNGSELVAGLQHVLGPDIALTGGLAGDGARFVSTQVGLNANPAPGRLAAVGFYGDSIRFGYGTMGGWEPIGPERLITRSEGNVLFDLDGQPALELYKTYLGPEAANLPASALLCPLRIYPPGQPEASLVRTILAIDPERHAMTFAGDVPEGYVAQVTIGHFDKLVAGAGRAAERAAMADAKLAILVSCIGRKLLMGQQIADEVDAVAEALGPDCRLTGFYSYGEIAPLENSPLCDLHNQTMTITTIAEG